MSSWGCPHDLNGMCTRVNNTGCDPGMKGCVLFGRFVWADESKNRPRPRRRGTGPETQADGESDPNSTGASPSGD